MPSESSDKLISNFSNDDETVTTPKIKGKARKHNLPSNWGQYEYTISWELLGDRDLANAIRPEARKLIGNANHRMSFQDNPTLVGHATGKGYSIRWNINGRDVKCTITAEDGLDRFYRTAVLVSVLDKATSKVPFIYFDIDGDNVYSSLDPLPTSQIKMQNIYRFISRSKSWYSESLDIQLATYTVNNDVITTTYGNIAEPIEGAVNVIPNSVWILYGNKLIAYKPHVIDQTQDVISACVEINPDSETNEDALLLALYHLNYSNSKVTMVRSTQIFTGEELVGSSVWTEESHVILTIESNDENFSSWPVWPCTEFGKIPVTTTMFGVGNMNRDSSQLCFLVKNRTYTVNLSTPGSYTATVVNDYGGFNPAANVRDDSFHDRTNKSANGTTVRSISGPMQGNGFTQAYCFGAISACHWHCAWRLTRTENGNISANWTQSADNDPVIIGREVELYGVAFDNVTDALIDLRIEYSDGVHQAYRSSYLIPNDDRPHDLDTYVNANVGKYDDHHYIAHKLVASHSYNSSGGETWNASCSASLIPGGGPEPQTYFCQINDIPITHMSGSASGSETRRSLDGVMMLGSTAIDSTYTKYKSNGQSNYSGTSVSDGDFHRTVSTTGSSSGLSVDDRRFLHVLEVIDLSVHKFVYRVHEFIETIDSANKIDSSSTIFLHTAEDTIQLDRIEQNYFNGDAGNFLVPQASVDGGTENHSGGYHIIFTRTQGCEYADQDDPHCGCNGWSDTQGSYGSEVWTRSI